MSRNRIIGINGKLPWSIPEDRTAFQALTKDKVLIIGRRTYEEESNERHIDHAKDCIVVSASAEESLGSSRIHVARSFPDALRMAKNLIVNDNEQEIKCWVAGGESLYEEALKHKSAHVLHLTVVDLDLDPTQFDTNEGPAKVALFPRKYIWDRLFKEISKTRVRTETYNYTQIFYERKTR